MEYLSGRHEDRLVQCDEERFVLRHGGVLVECSYAVEIGTETVVDMDIKSLTSACTYRYDDGLDDESFFLLCCDRELHVSVGNFVNLSSRPCAAERDITVFM